MRGKRTVRKYVLCMLFLLLLTACQSAPQQAERPTPEPTLTPAATGTPTLTETVTSAGFHAPEGLELDVGDGKHKFWIEITEREEEVGGVWVNIYRDKEDSEPYQRFEDRAFDFHRAGPHSVDADFDGNMDFYFPCQVGANNGFYSFWLWDGETGTFIEEKAGLGSLSYPYFEPEEKLIRSHMLDSATCSTDFIYTWREGELVCLRSVYHAYSEDMETVQVMVWDEELGTIENTYPRDSNWTQWLDLDYPGE